MFKDGVAGETDGRDLADLDPAPPYEEMAQAQGAYAERVEKPADLPDALARARKPCVSGRRQALLNVITPLLKSPTNKPVTEKFMRIDAYTHFIPKKIFRQASSTADFPTSASACGKCRASTISTCAGRWSIRFPTTRRSSRYGMPPLEVLAKGDAQGRGICQG